MKKILLCFLLFAFHFSGIKAQDTLVFKTGLKVVGKIFSAGKDGIVYTLPPSEKQMLVSSSEILYIRYGNGSKYTIPKPKIPNPAPININTGIGFSTITWALPNAFNLGGDPGTNIISETPAYNLTADYNVTNNLSVGLGGAYQSITDNPLTGEVVATWETERITRTNISGRCLYQFSKNPSQHDIYVGVRIGLSMWTDGIASYNSNGYLPLPAPPPIFRYPFLLMAPYSKKASYQAFFGYRKFVSKNFGFHFEAGIGSPYLIEGGITFRFNTRKNKTK